MTHLVDTSAWIEYLRGTGSPAHLEVRRLLREEPGQVALTEPVIMELLAGPADHRVVTRLEQLVDGLPLICVDAALDYRAAAAVYRATRLSGRTVRSLVHCLIAVVAERTGTVVVHRDRDFDVLAQSLPDLRVQSL